MIKKIIYIGIGSMLLVAPFLASAATASDLQAQVQGLLTQIQTLQSQGGATVSGNVRSSPAISSCITFNRSLSIGSRGSDVTSLQQFLSSQGYLNVSATGYFGVMTRAALGKWQVQNGIAVYGSGGYGIFGPLSRAYLSRICGGATTTGTGTNFTASPTSGAAPLTVQFTSSAPQGTSIGKTVDFGDGTTGTLGVVPVCSSCNAMGIVSHTYASAGTYTATLTGGSCACPAGGICNCPNIPILGTATVTVGPLSVAPSIQQLNAPASVSLSQGGIAEIRNESAYFTLEGLSSSSATIQITPVGCWNSFPSDTPPRIMCMLAMLPIPQQVLTIGQAYASQNYGITLTQIAGGSATFSVAAL
jgi:peptidoglycan hydrolase-like protein with peptidoglycan-binding domain